MGLLSYASCGSHLQLPEWSKFNKWLINHQAWAIFPPITSSPKAWLPFLRRAQFMQEVAWAPSTEGCQTGQQEPHHPLSHRQGHGNIVPCRMWYSSNPYLYRERRSAFTAVRPGSAQYYRHSSPVHNFYSLQYISDWNIALFTRVTWTMFLMLFQIDSCCVFFPHFAMQEGREHPKETWSCRHSVLRFKG